jgi:hypothetical protein
MTTPNNSETLRQIAIKATVLTMIRFNLPVDFRLDRGMVTPKRRFESAIGAARFLDLIMNKLP